MIKYSDKKWVLMQGVPNGRFNAPPKDTPWTNDTNVALCKMLQANASHVNNNDIDYTADIYILILLETELYERYLEFIKEVHSRGAKVILCVSSDHRFMVGQGLLNSRGINYTDICAEADLIFSQVPESLKLYGRYQSKVIGVGMIPERVNFGLPYDQRDIDILLSGTIPAELSLSYAIEIMMMLKEKYPDKRIVYPTQYVNILQPRYPSIEFVHVNSVTPGSGLVDLLRRSKHYINPELRPTAGRAMVESFYCRTPYVCSSMSFASKYFPDFTYDNMNLEHIVNQYDKMLNSNRGEIIQKAEQLAEEDYFGNLMIRVMDRLYNNT